MNPDQATKNTKIPFYLFGKGVGNWDPKQTNAYTKIVYNIAAEASEQIAVDGVTHAATESVQVSQLEQQMQGPLNAVTILRSRLQFIIRVLKEKPEVRQNPDFMRRVSQIVNSAQIASSK